MTDKELDILSNLVKDLDENFNDSHKANEIAIQMCDILGVEPIRDINEFDKLIESNKPLVIF